MSSSALLALLADDSPEGVDAIKAMISQKEESGERGWEEIGGASILHWAAEAGNTPIVEYLLDRLQGTLFTVDQKESQGSTPLMWAAGEGHLETSKLLIARGAMVSLCDHMGDTPLHYAA